MFFTAVADIFLNYFFYLSILSSSCKLVVLYVFLIEKEIHTIIQSFIAKKNKRLLQYIGITAIIMMIESLLNLCNQGPYRMCGEISQSAVTNITWWVRRGNTATIAFRYL